MSRNAAFWGVMRWSASGSRTGALVMGASPSVAERTPPTVVAVTVSSYHLILVIHGPVQAHQDPVTGGLARAAARQQPQLPGALHSRGPVPDLELGIDAADVRADRVHRDGQLAGDLRPGQVRREISQHPELSWAELLDIQRRRLISGRRG